MADRRDRPDFLERLLTPLLPPADAQRAHEAERRTARRLDELAAGEREIDDLLSRIDEVDNRAPWTPPGGGETGPADPAAGRRARRAKGKRR